MLHLGVGCVKLFVMEVHREGLVPVAIGVNLPTRRGCVSHPPNVVVCAVQLVRDGQEVRVFQ